uniref:Membrane transporter protein n=1 Tax=Parascaris univalens TaxID=6257 RepID=A0A915BS72_PARUN
MTTSEESSFYKAAMRFLNKYFLEGQKLSESERAKMNSVNDQTPFMEKLLIEHRRLLGVAIPFVFFQTLYWLLAFRYSFFRFYSDKYVMTIVMVFGALIGGMTTEGGGAIAFPVMTIALNIDPIVARDFSLMIQSCGMFHCLISLQPNSLLPLSHIQAPLARQ